MTGKEINKYSPGFPFFPRLPGGPAKKRNKDSD